MPAVLLLVVATLLWAGNYVVAEQVVGNIGPLSLTWWRWALSAVPLVVIAQVLERPDWAAVVRRWRMLLVLGLVGVAGYPLLLYAALQHTTAASAAVINATNPAVLVLAAVLLGQAVAGWRTWAGVALGLLGVLIVLTDGDVGRLLALRLNVGDVLMLAAVLAWTAYTLLGRRLGVAPLVATAAQVVLAVLVLTPVALVSGLAVPQEPTGWWSVVFIALGPSIGSYVCWNLAVTRVSPAVAGVSMNLVTVFTLVLATLLGRPPTAMQLLGGALVIGGVVLTTGLRRRGGRLGRPSVAARQ